MFAVDVGNYQVIQSAAIPDSCVCLQFFVRLYKVRISNARNNRNQQSNKADELFFEGAKLRCSVLDVSVVFVVSLSD